MLVVKGGSAALTREIEELLAPSVPALRAGELDERASAALLRDLAQLVLTSDHIEDVFADDRVIEGELGRVVQGGVWRRGEPLEDVRIKLDTLGYVAATAARLAPAEVVRAALERGAAAVHACFVAVHGAEPTVREALFRIDGADEDGRLELEEAVAEELAGLVEDGLVTLPEVACDVDLGREMAPLAQDALNKRIEQLAPSIRRHGPTSWSFTGPRTLHLSYTPLSEPDASEAEQKLRAFSDEIVVASSELGISVRRPTPPLGAPRTASVRLDSPKPAPVSPPKAASKSTPPSPSPSPPAARPIAKPASTLKLGSRVGSAKSPRAAGKAQDKP